MTIEVLENLVVQIAVDIEDSHGKIDKLAKEFVRVILEETLELMETGVCETADEAIERAKETCTRLDAHVRDLYLEITMKHLSSARLHTNPKD